MRTSMLLVAAVWLCTVFFSASGESSFAQSPAGCPQCSSGDPGDCSCDLSGCCGCPGDRERFLGFLRSDHCFDRFISPISNPFFFEDPRSLTEVRGIFIDNSLPRLHRRRRPGLGGPASRPISDRLSVIAPRLSYIKVNQSKRWLAAGISVCPRRPEIQLRFAMSKTSSWSPPA